MVVVPPAVTAKFDVTVLKLIGFIGVLQMSRYSRTGKTGNAIYIAHPVTEVTWDPYLSQHVLVGEAHGSIVLVMFAEEDIVILASIDKQWCTGASLRET